MSISFEQNCVFLAAILSKWNTTHDKQTPCLIIKPALNKAGVHWTSQEFGSSCKPLCVALVFTPKKMNSSFLICLFFLSVSAARPWNFSDDKKGGIDIVAQELSPLTTTLDSMTSRFSKTLKSISPSLTPVLSVASLAYMGYVASVMMFPSALRSMGVPLLDDVSRDAKATRTSGTGLIDSLATELMKDMIGRTEAAVILRNTSLNAVRDGMSTLKKTTRMANLGLGSLRGLVDKVVTALDPNCLKRTMCQVGQFTSLHLPLLGPMLRSVNTIELDDFSQALIDGTSIGDCSAVYFDCTLSVQ